MASAPQQTDPRREQLRRQAIQRRQAVLDRIAGARAIVIGGVIAVSCVLAGYLDASAHSGTTSNSTGGLGATGYSGGVTNYGGADSNQSSGGNSQSLFGGGSPPTASSGGGSVVSGGS